MSDYIEREAAIDGLREHLRYMLDGAPISQGTRDIYEMAYRHCIDKINSLPAADVREVVRGKWTMHSDHPDRLICSECGAQFDVWHWEAKQMHFCPNCGAEMR